MLPERLTPSPEPDGSSFRRGLALAAVLAVAVAAGAVAALSVADAGTDSGSPPAESERIVIDGVDIYRSELSNGGPAVYSFDPPSQAEIDGAERLSDGLVGSEKGRTTGDLAGCSFLVEQPGPVTQGCAMMFAQEQHGDLDLLDGPAQRVYAVCGREPVPGEYEACGNGWIPESEIVDALEQLRAELRE